MKSNILNKRKLLLGGLFVMLVFSTFLYLPIQASDDEDETDDDDDDDGVHDDEELINERELQIDVDDYDAQIRSRLKTGEVNIFGIMISSHLIRKLRNWWLKQTNS